MNRFDDVTSEGDALVTGVREWFDKDHEQVEWRLEVPEGVTHFTLVFEKQRYPGPPLTKGPAQTVNSATVVTGRAGLKPGDKIPVLFWWQVKP